jgi:phage-related minor tail protein
VTTEKVIGKAQIDVDVNGEAIDPSVEKAKRTIGSLGTAAVNAGKVGAQGLGQIPAATEKIGPAADKSAKEIERATRNIASQIQRQIAVMEAGAAGSTKYFEALANQRGASLDALRPYLAQLDAVKAKQDAANAALTAATPAVRQLGISAGQTKAALAGLPAQITDIVTSLQGGQRPITVLLQQGGQLKDMFGGIVPAARALGGYIAGLVGPATLAAGAIGVLGAAYYFGAEQTSTFNKQIILSGNAAGATISSYRAMAAELAAVGGTQGSALEAISTFVQVGKVGADSLQRFVGVAQQLDRLVGKPVADTAKEFASLAEAPVEASLKLTEKYNYLTAATYEQIKALKEQGRVTEAARLAQEAYASALEARIPALQANLGTFERGWNNVAGAAKKAWDAMLGVGRQATLAERLASVSKEIEKARGPFDASAFGGNAEARAKLPQLLLEQSSLQEMVRLEQRSADAAGARARQVAAAGDFEQLVSKHKTEQKKLEEEIAQIRARGLDAGKTQKEIDDAVNAARLASAKKNPGTAGVGESEVASIKATTLARQQYLDLLRTQGAEAEKLTDGEKLVIKIQQELQTSIKGTARAQKEKALAAAQDLASTDRLVRGEEERIAGLKASREALDKQIDGVRASARSIQEQALGQEAANAAFGKSKTAVEESTLSLIRLQLAEAESSDRFDPAYIASLADKEAAQRRFVAALKETEEKQLRLRLQEGARVAGEETQSLQLELQLLGESATVREQLLAKRRVELKLAKEISEIDKANISEDAKERLRSEARANATIEESNATTRVVLDQWKAASEQINNSLTDALLRGFEDGKGIARNFRETLVNMFKTLVLRPVISAVVNPIGQSLGGAVTQLLGGGQGGGSILGSLGSVFGNGGLGSLGSTLFGASSYAAAVPGLTATGAGSQAAMLAAQTGEFGLAGLTSTAGSAGGLLGAIAPYAGPLAIGGLVLSSLLKGHGETRSGGQYEGTTFVRGPSGGEIAGDEVRTIITTTIDGINKSLEGVGSKLRLDKLFTGLESSTKGKGFAFVGGRLTDGSEFGQGADGQGFNNRRGNLTPEQALAAVKAEAEQASLQALQSAASLGGRLVTSTETSSRTVRSGADQEDTVEGTTKVVKRVFDAVADTAAEEASGIPKVIRDKLRGVDIDALGDEARKKLLGEVNAIIGGVTAFNKAISLLPLERLKALGFDAAAGLIEMAGGVEKLLAGIDAYASNFFTPEEQRVNTARNIKKTLDDAGGNFTLEQILGGDRASFRKVTEAFEARYAAGDKEAGKFLAALYSVAGAFASITPEAETAASRMQKLQAETDRAFAALERSVASQRKAAEAARQVAGERVSELQGIFDLLKGSVRELYGQVDSARQQSASQARAFISDALATARSTGYLPDREQLGDAITDAKAGIDGTRYKSRVDRDFDRLVLAGQLKELQDIAGPQLTTAEQALKAAERQVEQLDLTLDYWRDQIQLSRGQIDAVTGVEDAVGRLAAALLKEKSPTQVANGAAGAGPASSGASFGAGAAGAPAGRQLTTSLGVPIDFVGYATARLDDPAAIANEAKRLGLSMEDVAELFKKDAGDVRTWFNLQGVESFDKGTPFVPRDMYARLHAGEAVIPAIPAQRWRDTEAGANRALAAGLDNQAKALMQMQRTMSQIARSSREGATDLRTLNSRPVRVKEVS